MKRHPADIAAEAKMVEAIRGAAYFMASVYTHHGYLKTTTKTVRAARAAGIELAATANNGRKAILYACDAEDRATMLTDALIDRLFAMQSKQES